MMETFKDIWTNAKATLKETMQASTYNAWIADLEFGGMDGNSIILMASSEFAASWIVDSYLSPIKAAIEKYGCYDAPLNVRIRGKCQDDFSKDWPRDTQCRHCGRPLGAGVIDELARDGKEYVYRFCGSRCHELWRIAQENMPKIKAAIDANIQPVYQDSCIEKLPPTYNDQGRRILNWRYGPRGYIAVGPTGVGKTRMTMILLRRLIEQEMFGVKYSLMTFYAGELERYTRKAADYDDAMNKLSRARLVVIDDLGKEKFTERYEYMLFNLLETRTNKNLPTLITTNHTGDSLMRCFKDPSTAEPFRRRINEFFDRILLKHVEQDLFQNK